ncbi:hypothetical protein MIND_00016900 [Mycena indigotica]|uniref:Uncharacterized protein n=1 Tax=Mycena indigotica TaxID=2126181 RepID=A0A8H6TE55_9AGAR|nr:uncharacterized protein MIND_00016900 [Mycena indigotica]KAF7315027.1 hypothetical protein MIND_00016900 [Mycena indigotica]
MDGNLYSLFNEMLVWLEEPHTYNIVSSLPNFSSFRSVQQHRVTFTVDPTLVDTCKELNQAVPELPSPVLLAIRAACCRVANLSGALEQHDIVLRELARTQTLAPDGDHGSAELLRMRLGSSLAH